jgi:ectoine hydroxylase-related dioxygenase (phytanoyl-CoA dioxygenase family)
LFSPKAATNAAAWLHAQDQPAFAKSWTEQEPGVPLAVYSVVHHGVDPIAELVTDTRILDVASALMGKPTYIWASKVNLKAAWCGTAEYYHQDLVYWKDRGYPRDEMLSCMVFLQKHSLGNAALHVLPGTHRCGFIPHMPFININGLSKRMIPPATMDRLYKAHGLVVIDAEPGDALFFHTSLVHGSSHNISPDGRMILLAQMNTVGNEPREVSVQAKQFNLLRAQMEYEEAGRRYQYFKEKYEQQMGSDELVFCPPIPEQER